MVQTYSYSVDMAKIFGINSAVFISYVDYMHVYMLKTKSNFDGKVAIKRNDMFDFTGLDKDKQIEVENALKACGVLEMKKVQGQADNHYYMLNEDLIMNALNTNNSKTAFTIKPLINVKTVDNKMTKKDKHIISLKKSIRCDSPIINQYLCDWIDAVYANPKGFLSSSSIAISQNDLYNATNNDDERINILKIAIKGGYRDLSWAIEQYKNNKSNSSSRNFASYNNIASDGSDVVSEEF